MAARWAWRNSALSSELTLPSRAARLPSARMASGFSSTSARSFVLNSLYRPRMILTSWVTCFGFRSILSPRSRHWYGCRPSTKSTTIVWMSSGVSFATCSMSTPPCLEAMNEIDLGSRAGRSVRHSTDGGLVGFHVGTEHALGGGADIVQAAAELHATGLTAATGMDLGLDHPLRAAKVLGGVDGGVGRVGNLARRHGDAVLGEQFFSLVLVEIHSIPRANGRKRVNA